MDAPVKPTSPLLAIFHEQAKSIIAIRELQSEVSNLLEFKNALLETFPHLHHKVTGALSQPYRPEDSHQIGLAKPDSGHDMSDNISTSWNAGQTNTGSMPRRRKLRKPPEGSSTSSTVADSGFSTGSSSLPSPSTGGKGPPVYPPVVRWDTWSGHMDSPPSPQMKMNENEDELMFLLDVIHRKVSKFKNEGEEQEKRQLSREESRKLSDRSRAGITLGAISENDGISSDNEIRATDASVSSLRRRNEEGGGGIGRNDRELLMERISELELENIHSHNKISKLQSELSQISKQKELLEDKLRTAITHKSELDTKIHDMHSQTNSGNGKDVGTSGIIHSVHILTGGVQTESSLNSSEGNSPKPNEFRKILNPSENNPRRVGDGVPEGAHGSVNIKIRQPHLDRLSRSSEQLVNAGQPTLSRIPKDPISHSVSVVNLKASTENLQTGGSFSDINALTRLRTNSLSASTGAILRQPSKPLVLQSDQLRFFQNKMAVPPNTKVSPLLKKVLSNEKLSSRCRSAETLYDPKRLHIKPTISEMRRPQKALITSSQGNLALPHGSQLKYAQSELVLNALGQKKDQVTGKRMSDSVVSMPAELAKGLKVKPNRERITQILSTTSVLELQRQLLTTVMENEVYKSQISRVTEGWTSKKDDFEKMNTSLRAHISRLKEDNHRLLLQMEEKSIELEGTKALIRQIEKDQPRSSDEHVQADEQFLENGQGLEELVARLGQDNYEKLVRLQEMARKREGLSSSSDAHRIYKKPGSTENLVEIKSMKQKNSLSRKYSYGSGSNKSAKNSILILQNDSVNKVEENTINSNLNMEMTKDSQKTMAQPPSPLHLDYSLSSVELRHMGRDTIAGLIAGILKKYTKKEEVVDTNRTGNNTRGIQNKSFSETDISQDNIEEKNENIAEKEFKRYKTSSQTRLNSPNQRPESQFMSQKSWEAYKHMEEETHGSHGHLNELATHKNASRRRTSHRKNSMHRHVNSFTHGDSLNEHKGKIYQSPRRLSQDSLHQVTPKDKVDVESLQFSDSLPPSKGVSSPVDSLIRLKQRKNSELYDSISSSQGKHAASKRRIIPYADDSLSSALSKDMESLESRSPGTNRTRQQVTGASDPVPQADVTLAIHHIKPSATPIRPSARRYSTNLSPPKHIPPQAELRIEDVTDCVANDPGVPQQTVQNVNKPSSGNLSLNGTEKEICDTLNQRATTKEKTTNPQNKSYVSTAKQATEKLKWKFLRW